MLGIVLGYKRMTKAEIDTIIETLTFKQRHTKRCRKDKGIKEWHEWPYGKPKCRCAWSACGVLDTTKGWRPHATGKTSFDAAKDEMRRQIASGKIGEQENQSHIRIETAVEEFTAFVKDRGSTKSTDTKYKILLDQFGAYCEWKGITAIHRFTQDDALEFRRAWSDPKAGYKQGVTTGKGKARWGRMSDGTAKRSARTLSDFFQRCIVRGWIEKNPTNVLSFPRAKRQKTKDDVKYLTEDQMTDVLWAVDKFERMTDSNKDRLRALILVMRWAGLRVSDAVVLTKTDIQNDVLRKRTKKAHTPVQVPLPRVVTDALAKLTPCAEGFYFWNRRSESSDVKSPIGNFSKLINEAFRKAGVQEKSKLTHRFRNTFAVDLLDKGVPLETVSLLLGHESVSTTERYYAAWTQNYMNRAEAMVRLAWTRTLNWEGMLVSFSRETTKPEE